MTNPNGSNWIRKAKRLRIYARDGWRCVWCETDLGPTQCGIPTIDHVIPREQGGSNETQNLITSCLGCNSARGQLSVFQFARRLWRDETATQSIWEHIVTVLNRVIHAIAKPLPAIKTEVAVNWDRGLL